MATESITESAVAIYMEEAELQELGLHIPVSAKDAKALISDVMRKGGRQPWGMMEVDMFTYDDSVLLLARPSGKAVDCFVFDDLEDLLGAAFCLAPGEGSTLIWLDGSYYLFFGPGDTGRAAPLYEFGRHIHCDDGSFAHMAEHGKVLLAGHAVGDLRRYFSSDVHKM